MLLHITVDRGCCGGDDDGGGRDRHLVQTAIKDGAVSWEQKKLQQGPAFIVHKQGLHRKTPRGAAQHKMDTFYLPH